MRLQFGNNPGSNSIHRSETEERCLSWRYRVGCYQQRDDNYNFNYYMTFSYVLTE